MKKLFAVLTVLFQLLMLPLASAFQPYHNFNTIPSQNASFITNLQDFLRKEDANRYSFIGFNGFVRSGGVISTGAGLTKTPTSMTAIADGYYLLETGAITFPASKTCYVIAAPTLIGNLTSYVRVSGTHYLMDCTNVSPALPSTAISVATIVTDATSVTTATDTRNVNIVLPVTIGGVGINTYTIGDLLYASGTTTLSKLADVATGNVLRSGGVGVAPSYGKVSLSVIPTHITGILPVVHGGTNSSAFQAQRCIESSADGLTLQETNSRCPFITVVDVFTSSDTWTKSVEGVPKHVCVWMVGGGGGGGSGRRGAAGSDRHGGSGGGGGAISNYCWPESLLGATETVTVASQAAGGTGIAVNDTDGNSGTVGGNSSFGVWLIARGGAAGLGGTAAAVASVAGGTGIFSGGTGGGSNIAGPTVTAGGQALGAAGGGSGGYISAANTPSNGADGGTGSSFRATPIAGGTGGVVGLPSATVGSDVVTNEASGGGGGGGSQGNSGDSGKAGGLYGGGGGGSGATVNGTASGAGGAGRAGLVIVVTYF